MSDVKPPVSRRTPWLTILAGITLVAAGISAGFFLTSQSSVKATGNNEEQQPRNIAKQIKEVCTSCHAYPSPKSFPRWAWKAELDQAYGFVTDPSSVKSKLAPMKPPPYEAVVDFFERHAPLELPPAVIERAAKPYGVQFAVSSTPEAPQKEMVSVSNVQLVRLTKDGPLELVACEMRAGLVMALRPDDRKPAWRTLAHVANPARVEVVDGLMGDGSIDLLVADLGNYLPTDDRNGKVIWLRGDGKGNFTPHTLIDGLGRVADVRAADFCGTGKKDLIVASFGFRRTGEVLFLENQTTDWNNPRFAPRVLDERHGAIHVPIADLNGDGKPDFVVLFAQEHEKVVAFINEGDGKFSQKVIYEAPDPAYGSSGIQLVDLDGDGKLDVLYTNGDVMDFPRLLKPYHGIRWLKNNGTFPFEERMLAPMYGVHSAVAADLRGKGVMDIVAVSFLPEYSFPSRKEKNIDSVILLEQTAPGQFARHTLESGTCDHVNCAVGKACGTERNDLIIANFDTKKGTPVKIWKNLGPRKEEPPRK